MNKKLIALAVAAIAAPAAYAADNEVTLYGQVNVGVVIADHWDVFTYGPNSVSQLRVDDLNTNSRFGLKGEENLGDGLSAFFKIEQNIGPDAAVSNNGKGNAFASREGWVGLKGAFGKIGLGRGKTAYQLATENFDLFDAAITLDLDAGDVGYNFGLALDKNPISAGTPTLHAALRNSDGTLIMAPTGATAVAGQPTSQSFGGAASYRFDNMVKYNYEANGLAVAVDYGAGEDKAASNGDTSRNFAASVQYNLEPFWVISAYNNQRKKNSDRTDNFLVGGGWGSGPLNLGVAYEYNRFTAAQGFNPGVGDVGSEAKQNLFLVNASYDIGPSTLKVGIIHGDKMKVGGTDVRDSDYERYVLGWRYGLSKRTATVVEYGHIDFKGSNRDASTFTVGLMHAF